jgi:methanesulfonate monooxygenase small subunit
MTVSRDDAVNLVSTACRHLDDENWAAFLELCDPAFRYRIVVRAPEVRREMIWFDQDYAGLEAMFAVVPEHLRRLGTFLRHVSVGSIEPRGTGKVLATSTFQCIHTDMEGRSRLMAAGRYLDEIRNSADGCRLVDRQTILATRDLGVGSHVPI